MGGTCEVVGLQVSMYGTCAGMLFCLTRRHLRGGGLQVSDDISLIPCSPLFACITVASPTGLHPAICNAHCTCLVRTRIRNRRVLSC